MKRKLKAFTLIELLVVIAIIIILAAVIIISLTSASAKAKDAKISSEAQTVSNAIQIAAAQNENPSIPKTNGVWMEIGTGDGKYDVREIKNVAGDSGKSYIASNPVHPTDTYWINVSSVDGSYTGAVFAKLTGDNKFVCYVDGSSKANVESKDGCR